MRRFALLTLAVAVLALPAGAHARGGAIFRVGAAVEDISPTASSPQYLGGYDRMDAPTGRVNDPLQVRAFLVAGDGGAVAFAVVDSQGWFAGYQEGPYGITDARKEAAARLQEMGYPVTPGALIVSSTHSHAAPTIMGIWGPTDPAYLKRVHDATVAALVAAGRRASPAELWSADGRVRDLIAHNYDGTDVFDGWGIDDSVPLLWARDPETGATKALYANLPVHADEFRGSKYGMASADTPGATRKLLEDALGGTAVVAMGTLGRQESMGSDDTYAEVLNQARYMTNRLTSALGEARPITDPTVLGAQQFVSVPAHNPALLALLYGNAAGTNCDNPLGNCTIDRALTPPYLAGNMVGTWVSALRIGNRLWVSEPGEAFNEVTLAIQQQIPAEDVHVVGMAQDQLGYYYPPEDYPQSQLNPSDFILFNVSPALADANVDAAVLAARKVGFKGTPAHPGPDQEDPDAFNHAGTQLYPSVTESANPARNFLVNGKPSQAPVAPGGAEHTVSPVTVDFGDGSPAETVEGEQRIGHTFPGPGAFRVTSTVSDETGTKRTYSTTVVVDRAPEAVIRTSRSGRRTTYTVRVRRGDGAAIAAHWTFPDGTEADGLRIVRREDAIAGATVTVVDGAGDTATATL